MSNTSNEILFKKFEIIECFKKDEHTGVYLANHIYLSKKIILKVLNTKTIPDPVIIDRFKREAKLLAKLNHPNIINVLDFGTDKDFFYISFEYFQGTSLRAIMKKNKLRHDQKIFMLMQILKGIDCAHRNGIIHRDIKPENIFINEKNELKIGDFGLAFDTSDNFITSQHSVVGTPCYMSPEQISGEKITEQSDLFSIGIVVFELLTGRNPFLGSDINETINNIISFEEKSLKQEISGMPADVSALLQMLLKKKPAQRIISAREALSVLHIEVDDNSNAYITRNKLIMAGILILIASTIVTMMVLTKKEQNIIENKSIYTTQKIDTVDSQENRNSIKFDSLNKPAENSQAVAAEPSYEAKNIPNQKTGLQQEPIKFGSLYVECFPWADVIIDSEMKETTPLSEDIKLSEGKHMLTLYNPVYPAYNKEISVIADELLSIRINMDTLFGYVNFNVFPWGEIYLDNKFIGQTPFLQPYKLSPGEYRTIIKNPSFQTKETRIIVLRNDTLTVTYNFEGK